MNAIQHGLSDEQIQILREVLSPFAGRITRAGLFGSRATGKARPNSDIDLVLYGDIDDRMLARIWTLFEDSRLALSVDVCAYDLIAYPPLKAHIDAVMQPLFSQADLSGEIAA